MKGFRYLKYKDRFLNYSYLALEDQFRSREDFDNYFNSIITDERKDLLLKTASFYLFLVKRGDWVVNIPDSDDEVDYLTDTHKYVAIFSLIESLSEEKFIDFYQFLTSRKSQFEFPVSDKSNLDKHYRKYKEKHGSIKRCISFFKTLNPDRQSDLISKLEVEGTEATIEKLAEYLYELRSKFVHEAKLVIHMTGGITIGKRGNKRVVCKLSIKDIMEFFEEGLIIHFQGN